MNEEQFLAEKSQQFSLLDIALVKIIYFLVGLLIGSNYIICDINKLGFLFTNVFDSGFSNSNSPFVI